MKVLLRRNWFTPFGRFKKSLTKKGPPVEIPNSLRNRLPSDAEIVDDDKSVYETVAEHTVTMAEAAEAEGMDMARLAAENEQQVRDLADGTVRKSTVEQIRTNAIEFQKELDAENARFPNENEVQDKPVKRGPGRPKKGT